MAKAKKKSAQLDIEDAVRTAVKQSVPQVPGGSRYVQVPWHKLRVSPATNARGGDYSPEGIAELAALIASIGLTTPLLVREGSHDAWEVLDGSRRHAAIGRLIDQGQWPADLAVPCYEANVDEAGGLEASLVSNIAREPMHPVRELEVFAELHSAGADVDTIAQRYGVSARVVRQRLALGGLAPEIRAAWRAGRLNAETAQAFATCADQGRQTKLFHELAKGHQLQAWAVRGRLTKDKPRINDSRIAFVGGLDVYRAAGGTVVESLFADDGYLEDGELLERIVVERMVARCAELIADGWAWAAPVAEVSKQGWWSWQRLQPSKVQYTADETARLAALGQEEKDLEELDELTDEQAARCDAIRDECQAIEAGAEARGFSPTQKRKGGCVVEGATVHYGVVRPSAAKAPPAQAAHDDADGDFDSPDGETHSEQQDDETGEGRITNALLLTITERQTVAASKALAQSPLAAQRLLVAALQSLTPRPVKISVEAYHEVRGTIGTHFRTALGKVAGMSSDELAGEIARLMATTLDLRIFDARNTITGSYHGADPESHRALIDALPGALYLAAMRAEFDAGDYFKRSPAAVIKAAIAEMDSGRPLSDRAKKADLVAIATELAGPTGWLPAELRHPDYELLDPVLTKATGETRTKGQTLSGRRKKAKAA